MGGKPIYSKSSSLLAESQAYLVILLHLIRASATMESPIEDSSHGPHEPFSIYHALLEHKDIFFQFALLLPLDTMVELYAIHNRFRERFHEDNPRRILNYHVAYYAPAAARVHPVEAYENELFFDMDDLALGRRDWSVKWARMVVHRGNVVREILTLLALEGHRVPVGVEETMLKLWIAMNCGSGEWREYYLGDPARFTTEDCLNTILLMVKLDMRCGDPIAGTGVCLLSRMLMAHWTLSELLDVLRGDVTDGVTWVLERVQFATPIHELGMVEMMLQNMRQLGYQFRWAPRQSWGILYRHGWQRQGRHMDDVIDIVMKLAVVRCPGLIEHHILDSMLYGWVDEDTGEDRKMVQLTDELGRVDSDQAAIHTARNHGTPMSWLLGTAVGPIGLRDGSTSLERQEARVAADNVWGWDEDSEELSAAIDMSQEVEDWQDEVTVVETAEEWHDYEY